MKIFTEIQSVRAFLQRAKKSGARIGFVPTMGALHQGHMALIQAAKAENDITVCSIYVNPTQFNNSRDLKIYPRNIPQDIKLLKAEQCNVLFCPEDTEMYADFDPFRVDLGDLGNTLEGAFRPGHFNGVALVICKFFNIVQPDSAYFGQKDYQQFKIISSLRDSLKFPIDLKSIPTMRDPDGLALSSRNQHLTKKEQMNALSFFKALNTIKEDLSKGIPFRKIQSAIQHQFDRMGNVRLDYLELADCDTLKLLDDMDLHERAIALIAGHVGKVRLIDNMIIYNRNKKDKI